MLAHPGALTVTGDAQFVVDEWVAPGARLEQCVSSLIRTECASSVLGCFYLVMQGSQH